MMVTVGNELVTEMILITGSRCVTNRTELLFLKASLVHEDADKTSVR